MKKKRDNIQQLIGPFLALALAHSSAFAQTVLFLDDFDGDSSDLNGTTPDTTTGENWVAGPVFNADGTTEQNAGSATLAFTPVDGEVYTMEATYSGLGLVGDPDLDWFAMGFVNGQSDINGQNQRFIANSVVGTAWMMHRGDISLGTNQAFLGTGQLDGGNFGLGVGGGDNTGVTWALTPETTSVDFRMVLDTTGGTGAWTATWFAKASTDPNYLEIRPTETLLPGAVITAVGLARSNAGVNGTVERFSLTSSGSQNSDPLKLGISLEDGSPRIAVEAPDLLEVDLYRSTTAEPGTWGQPLITGLENGGAFVDPDAPAGRAFYIAVATGNPAP